MENSSLFSYEMGFYMSGSKIRLCVIPQQNEHIHNRLITNPKSYSSLDLYDDLLNRVEDALHHESRTEMSFFTEVQRYA